MTVTLADIIARAITLSNDYVIGRVVPLTSVSNGPPKTVTASSLAFGGNTEMKFAQKWFWRPDASASTITDRAPRYSDSWAPATGAITHSGTDYTDTTAPSERLFILETGEPYMFRELANEALGRIRRVDVTEIPARQGETRYYVGDLSWIEKPADVLGVAVNSSPVLSRNRKFEKWDTVATDGTLRPTHWTLSGTGATVAKSTTEYWRGSHVIGVTVASADGVLTQTVPVYRNGVDDYDLRGKSVTFVAWVQGSDSPKITIESGASSATDTVAASSWEELTAAITVPTTAAKIDIQLTTVASGDPGYFGEAYLVETAKLSDAVRKDNYEPYPLLKSEWEWEQNGTLALRVAPQTGQILLSTAKPYPKFDADRLITGAADSDETDAPEIIVATGLLYLYFEAREGVNSERTQRYKRSFEELCARHIYVKTPHRGGFRMVGQPLMPFAR